MLPRPRAFSARFSAAGSVTPTTLLTQRDVEGDGNDVVVDDEEGESVLHHAARRHRHVRTIAEVPHVDWWCWRCWRGVQLLVG